MNRKNLSFFFCYNNGKNKIYKKLYNDINEF